MKKILIATGIAVSLAFIPGTAYADVQGVEQETISCARGTRDLGVHEGYRSGKRINIRLCAVDLLPSKYNESQPGDPYYIPRANKATIVNATVSGKVQDMVVAARRDNYFLQVSSSFRSMARQRALCAENARCRRGDHAMVARPGYSGHQTGEAIDFVGPRTRAPRATCSKGRAVDPGSPTWVWLNKNARRFGFKQYAAESWHWDTMNMSNRC